MTAHKQLLGLIDSGREIRRAPLVGVQFLHERPVGASDLIRGCARRNAKDLISFLFRHFASGTPDIPRVRTIVTAFTPAGLPAIKISCE